MNKKNLPFDEELIVQICRQRPTPFHIYDERAIRKNAESFYEAFAWSPNFKNYFAVKATPNPFILKILKRCGMGADCSSLAELLLAEKVGIRGENIMFSSNDTPPEEFAEARWLGAVINLDDIVHIDVLERTAVIPELICFRYNPGSLRAGNAIIGDPVEAKYGLTRPQIIDAYGIMRDKGVRRFWLHAMIVSNMLDTQYLIDTAKRLFELVVEIRDKTGVNVECINLGGGIGIPYRPEQKAVDYGVFSRGVKKHYESIILGNGLPPMRIVMEAGRAITGPYGCLVTTVRHVTHKYKDYVGVDASMADLMRPAIYGAYHHITVLGKKRRQSLQRYDVTGSLCENNDKFAVDRDLPETAPGDILAIHDTGAHGSAMGFNYNGKLRPAELLLREDGEVVEIRRAETIDDYFATLDFNRLKGFRC